MEQQERYATILILYSLRLHRSFLFRALDTEQTEIAMMEDQLQKAQQSAKALESDIVSEVETLAIEKK